MARYQALMEQIATLQAKAEAVRQKECEGVIAQIKALMADYGLNLADITGRQRARSTKARAANKARYRNPETGQTWSGFGRAPGWIAGKDRASFAV